MIKYERQSSQKSAVPIIASLLLLTSCAYQPNIPSDQQTKPSYAADLQACQDKQWENAKAGFGPFGLVSTLYQRSQMSDEQYQEHLAALDKSTYIDNCMKQKGYTVQPK